MTNCSWEGVGALRGTNWPEKAMSGWLPSSCAHVCARDDVDWDDAAV